MTIPVFDEHSTNRLSNRREYVFILLTGLFVGTLCALNLIGISRFADLSFSIGSWNIPMAITIGMIPYPLTFICSDLICEFYGRKRASIVICVGFIVNIWLLLMVWLGGWVPPHVPLDSASQLPAITHPDYPFYKIRMLYMGSVVSSMLAYIFSQLLDVYLFQFWKNMTKGKHLWLRTNGSTLVSQLLDSIIVTCVMYYLTGALPHFHHANEIDEIIALIFSSYVYKIVCTLICTIPFYFAVAFLRKYFSPADDKFPLIKPPIKQVAVSPL
jgi:uncharacterized integral membrane protein (TIGR00697 family)